MKQKKSEKNPVLLEYVKDLVYVDYLKRGKAFMFPDRFLFKSIKGLYYLSAAFTLLLNIVNILDYAIRLNDIQISGVLKEQAPLLRGGIGVIVFCTAVLVGSAVFLHIKKITAFFSTAMISSIVMSVHYLQQAFSAEGNIENLTQLILRHLLPICLLILSSMALLLLQYYYKSKENKVYKQELRKLYLENANDGEILTEERWNQIFADLETELYGGEEQPNPA